MWKRDPNSTAAAVAEAIRNLLGEESTIVVVDEGDAFELPPDQVQAFVVFTGNLGLTVSDCDPAAGINLSPPPLVEVSAVGEWCPDVIFWSLDETLPIADQEPSEVTPFWRLLNQPPRSAKPKDCHGPRVRTGKVVGPR